jgi:methylenetetrahydrofolate reductase (NADPH)
VSILSASQIKRFTGMCGARIPEPLAARLETLSADDAAAAEFGIEYATKQCQELLDAGVPGIHFYTLNKSQATRRILRNLGIA